MIVGCKSAVLDAPGNRRSVVRKKALDDLLKPVKDKYDFIVSRAVMPLPDLVKIVKKNIAKEQKNALPNGIICLKGGNLDAELQPYRKLVEKAELSQWFGEEWFKEKHLVYLPI